MGCSVHDGPVDSDPQGDEEGVSGVLLKQLDEVALRLGLSGHQWCDLSKLVQRLGRVGVGLKMEDHSVPIDVLIASATIRSNSVSMFVDRSSGIT